MSAEIKLKNQKNRKTMDIYTHLTRNTLIGLFLIVIALSIGMLGYHFFEHLSWLDAFLNASMILSGMGPASPTVTSGGKLFAGCYALFSGLAFIGIIVVIISPIIHKFFRKLHLEYKDED